MSNRILRVEVHDRSLAPARAEVWVRVVPERVDGGTEVRGRLTGPRCAYAATVEVAYPLLPLPPGARDEGTGITRRVVIPEASLWEPQSPFLYAGPVELWQDRTRCDHVVIRRGLRALTFGPRGLRLNGKPLTLRGREVRHPLDDAQAQDLRRGGCNLLMADVGPAALWDMADRLGFLMLGRVGDGSEETLRQVASLAEHPCCLGWLVGPGVDFRDRLPVGGLVGLEAQGTLAGPLSEGVDFVLGSAADVALGQPLLLDDSTAAPPEGALVLGSISQ
jgi:hypothetical protein